MAPEKRTEALVQRNSQILRGLKNAFKGYITTTRKNIVIATGKQAITKRGTRKKHTETLENFVSNL